MSAATVAGASAIGADLGRIVGAANVEAKLAVFAELDLDFLAVVNPGCQRQLIAGLRRARLRTRVLHLAELVALAQAESPGR